MDTNQKPKRRKNPSLPKRRISVVCDQCQKKITAVMGWHAVVACNQCGKFYWALQPGRDGVLVLFPHPGFIKVERQPETSERWESARPTEQGKAPASLGALQTLREVRAA